MKRESKYCPSCGRLKPEPLYEELQATVSRPCELCGTRIGEVRLSMTQGAVTCLNCHCRPKAAEALPEAA